MTTITTRATKGSTLTYNELDANFSRNAQAKVANYTVVEGDNNDTIECSGTFTVTLPDAAAIVTAADTGDFEVTLKNSGTGVITVGRTTGTDTIDGTAANLTLRPNDSALLKVNQAGNGYRINASHLINVASVAGTGASTTMEITTGLGGNVYEFVMRADSSAAGGGVFKYELNGDTVVTNYYSSVDGGVEDNDNINFAVTNNTTQFLYMVGTIRLEPSSGDIYLDSVASVFIIGAITIQRFHLRLLGTHTAINSFAIKEYVTGGFFRTTSYLKMKHIF